MRKFLKTVNLLFWGNLAIVVLGLYLLVVVLVSITEAFLLAIEEIWING
jgi:hypothetical protein